MMRNEFSYRSLHGAPRARRRLLYVTVFVILLIVSDIALGGRVRSGVRYVASAAWRFSAEVRGTISNTGYFSSHRYLATENGVLREQLARSQEKSAGYDVLLAENDELRRILLVAQAAPGHTAAVVSSFRASPYGTFLISVGESDVAPGDLVLGGGGFVIGDVSETTGRTALVKSFFSAGSSIDVIIGGSSATVSGHGGGNGRASLPRGVEVKVGDPVIAPSLSGRPIGIVGKIESSPTSADQKLFIQLPTNLATLRFVYVIPHQ